MKKFFVVLAMMALLVPGLAFAHGIDSNRTENEIDKISIKGGQGGFEDTRISIKQKQITTTIGGNNEIFGGEGGEGGAVEVDVNTEVNTNTKQRRIPVSTAYAPALTSSNGTCMGSSSIGGQGMMFGLSLGTTWTSEKCNTRYDVMLLKNLGHEDAALSLFASQNEEVANALRAAGVKFWSLTGKVEVPEDVRVLKTNAFVSEEEPDFWFDEDTGGEM